MAVATSNLAHTSDMASQNPRQLLHNAPSIRLHIMLKGQNMQIHGQSVFDVFAKPVMSADAKSLRYDGFATFIQGDSESTYMLIDGSAYVAESARDDTTSATTQTIRCLSSITPFDSIVDALNNLTAISSSSGGDDSELDCPTEGLHETRFGGKHFVVCSLGPDGVIASGGDIAMTVEYLDHPLNSLSAPKLTDGSESCTVVAKPTPVSLTAIALLTGKEVSPA